MDQPPVEPPVETPQAPERGPEACCAALRRRIPSDIRKRMGLIVAGVIAVVLALAVPWHKVLANLITRHEQKAALSSLIEEADRLGLDYETVQRDPAGSVGKPVVWCVDHPDSGVAYLAGRPSQPLALENDAVLQRNSTTTGGRCTTVVAVIMQVRPNAVALRVVGLP